MKSVVLVVALALVAGAVAGCQQQSPSGKAKEPAAAAGKDSASKEKGQDKAAEDPLAGLELKKNSEGPTLNPPITSAPADPAPADPFSETKPKLQSPPAKK
jgi:hypothetical protein